MTTATRNERRRGRRRLLLAGGAAVVAAAVAGFALSPSRDAIAARRAWESGNLDEAAAAAERWLSAEPRSAEAHFLKAQIAWRRGDPATVQTEIERARELGFPEARMARLAGLVLARANRPDQAEPLLRQAFDAGHPADPEVAEALARIYLGSFRLSEAADVLERWAREVPDDARPCLLRTEIDRRTARDAGPAIASYREALRRDPTLDQARLGLGDVLRGSHHNAEAAEQYAIYTAHKPEDPLGHLGAGQNALDMGNPDEAARSLDRALELAPRNAVALSARASVEVQAGRLDAARVYLDRAVAADPFDQAIRFQRSLVFSRLGRKDEADADRRAIEQLRKDQEAFGRLREELIANPRDPGLRSQAARWLMTHGHEEEAVEWARLVLAAQPSNPAMNRLLADYYRKRGQAGLANFHEALAPPAAPGGEGTR